MSEVIKSAAFLVTTLLLTACGGGSSGTDSGPQQPTPSQIIADAKSYSPAQLEKASRTLATNKYNGKSANANVDLAMSQRVLSDLFGDSDVTSIDQPPVLAQDFADYVNADGTLDYTFSCFYRGTSRYVGTIDDNGIGNISIKYSNCVNEFEGYAFSGTVAVSITDQGEEKSAYQIYFDDLTWQDGGETVVMYGLIDSSSEFKDLSSKTTSIQYITYDIAGEQVKIDTQTSIEWVDANSVVTGDIYFGNEGKIGIEYESVYGLPSYITISGDKTATYTYDDGYVLYTEDTDNDGTDEVGTYFRSWYDAYSASVDSIALVDIELVSKPPSVGFVSLDFTEVFVTTPIEVSPGYYYDPDTPESELDFSYNWFINGELLANQNGSVLPAGLAKSGDEVGVALVVFDGSSRIQGYVKYFTISDSPAQVSLSNVPETTEAGSIVQFTAEIVDPDVLDDVTTATLVAGPQGATIDSDGVVTWNVPDDFLFPNQDYAFTFGWPDSSSSDTFKLSITASSQRSHPIVKTGLNVPTRNDSQWVGDFDGDGKNELLSTNNVRTISLVNVTDSEYSQQWVYARQLPSDGNIIAVMAADVNTDGTDDIVVATSHGISMITDINANAQSLLTSSNYIQFAKLFDVNDDGVPEVVFIESANQYSESNLTLRIIQLSNPGQDFFTLSVNNVRDAAVANVDEDAAVELVLNNGLVYDLGTGANQWFYGQGFSTEHIAAGDLDGDGIAEIVGADLWGNVVVYSGVTKSQLVVMDAFNVCDITTADIDADNKDELLVGDCQWGNIHSYDLTGSSLSEAWAVDMGSHGSTSVTVGDADNDGLLEVLWGSGVSHSGENILVSADLDGSNAALNTQRSSIQLDSFNAAGWAELSAGEDRGVFFVPSSGSGYDGSRIVMMDEGGNMTIGDEISSNWDNSRIAVTADFNNDGQGDIFVPSSETYDGAISVIQLNDNYEHWTLTGSYDNDINVVRAADMNNDGYTDMLFSDNKTIKIVDVQNSTLLATHTFDGRPVDFVGQHNGSEGIFVAGHSGKLSLLSLSASSLVLQQEIEQNCERLELINFDTDADKELLCLSDVTRSYGNREPVDIVVYDLTGNSLTEVQRTQVSNAYDIAIDPSSATNQGWFLIFDNDPEYYDDNREYRVAKYSNLGYEIWSGSPLLGIPQTHNMKLRYNETDGLELLLSTSQAMYWLH